MRTKLQLVGITSMFIASKYEEIYAPEIKDFTYITDNTYSKDELVSMESSILLALDFNLMISTPLLFFDRLSHLIGADDRVIALARYLLELSFLQISFLKHCPLLLATSSLYISNKLFRIEAIHWKDMLLNQVSFTESEIREAAKDLCKMYSSADEISYNAVKKKFADEKFGGISKATVCKR